MFKAFIKHYLLIVCSLMAAIVMADYWYSLYTKKIRLPVIPIEQILPLAQAYCATQNCINQPIPIGIANDLILKESITIPVAQANLLESGSSISVIGMNNEHYHYLNFDDKHYLQLGPVKIDTTSELSFYTSLFYILLAVALFLGFYPLFSDMNSLNKMIKKFKLNQHLTANDFPESPYFQQIFSVMREMLEKIGRLVALQKELSDTLSHEVRTNLSSAKFTISSMNEENHQQLKPLIEQDIKEIERLVQEYLSFSKQEHHNPSLVFKEQSPVELINEYVEKLLRFSDKKVSVEVQSNGHTNIDQSYFSRVVKNLIDNALKHARYEIKITVLLECEYISIHIEDDGQGLHSDNFEDLFLPFNRESDEPSGYGLGLAIAKKIVDWHNGRIIASNSTALSGAKFSIKLPLAGSKEAPSCLIKKE